MFSIFGSYEVGAAETGREIPQLGYIAYLLVPYVPQDFRDTSKELKQAFKKEIERLEKNLNEASDAIANKANEIIRENMTAAKIGKVGFPVIKNAVEVEKELEIVTVDGITRTEKEFSAQFLIRF